MRKEREIFRIQGKCFGKVTETFQKNQDMDVPRRSEKVPSGPNGPPLGCPNGWQPLGQMVQVGEPHLSMGKKEWDARIGRGSSRRISLLGILALGGQPPVQGCDTT